MSYNTGNKDTDQPYPGEDGKGSPFDTARYNSDGSLKTGQTPDPDPGKRPFGGADIPLNAPGSGATPGVANDSTAGAGVAPASTKAGVNANVGVVNNGVFDPHRAYTNYSVDLQTDPNYAANRSMLHDMAAKAGARPDLTMTAANAAGVNVDTRQQAQTRNAQTGLISQLQEASSGNGPSAAQQQLKTGADRTMASNLAMAAAAGTPGAERQAAFNNAAATQDLAGQSAVLRANEINTARGQLGQVSTDARGQDIGLATNVAQLGQQNNQFNAGLAQDAGKTNLTAGVEQQKQRDALVQSYTAAGLSLDEANRQADLQQRQFNASLGVQQEGIKMGVAANASQSNAALAGAGISAAGTTLASGVK